MTETAAAPGAAGPNMFDVSGRVALITGSSRGIGKALARGLLGAGCTVVLNGRDSRTLSDAQRELAENVQAEPIMKAFDVTDAASVGQSIAEIEERVGPIDILVNNAGMQRRAHLTEFDIGDWDRMLATNLTSAFLVSREVARHMMPRGRGKIVNICSVQSELARAGIAPYCATKGGLKQLTKGMCADLGPSGIQVNGIAPGYFRTELTAPLVADKDFSEWVRGRTPARRWGETDDLIGALIFLSSRASDFVNGQVIYVDGGMVSVL